MPEVIVLLASACFLNPVGNCGGGKGVGERGCHGGSWLRLLASAGSLLSSGMRRR